MPIIRLPGGDLRDEIRQPIYDTLSVRAGDVTAFTGSVNTPAAVAGSSGPNTLDGQQFFSNVQGKQRWQTNMLQANLLQTAVSFRMQGMALDVQYVQGSADGSYLTNIHGGFLPALQDFGSLRLRIGEKDYWEGPLAYLMGRIVGNAGSQSYQHAGQPAVQGIILAGRHVVDINPLQAFFAELDVSVPTSVNGSGLVDLNAAATSTTAAFVAIAANQALDVVNAKFSLKGLLRRPVQ